MKINITKNIHHKKMKCIKINKSTKKIILRHGKKNKIKSYIALFVDLVEQVIGKTGT